MLGMSRWNQQKNHKIFSYLSLDFKTRRVTSSNGCRFRAPQYLYECLPKRDYLQWCGVSLTASQLPCYDLQKLKGGAACPLSKVTTEDTMVILCFLFVSQNPTSEMHVYPPVRSNNKEFRLMLFLEISLCRTCGLFSLLTSLRFLVKSLK